MRNYFIRRLLLLIPTIVGITIVVVGLVRLLPGDAVDAFADEYRGTAEQIEEVKAELRAQLGLDKSFPEQWADWFWNLLQGDLGYSFHGRERTVWQDIRERIPVTFELGILAMIVGLVVAMPVGIYSAVRQDTSGDYLARGVAILFLAVPSFWLAILIISIVFPRLGLPPLPIVYRSPTEDLIENLRQMYVPAIVLGVSLAGPVMRLTRAQMLEVLRQDYIRTARAKGLREQSVINGHALRNALIPVITLIGLQVGIVIGGSVIMETIFVLPGMGKRMITALQSRDTPVVLGIMFCIAIVVVAANLIVDITYSMVDPRIRYQ